MRIISPVLLTLDWSRMVISQMSDSQDDGCGRSSHVLVVWIRDVYVSPSEVIEWPEFMNPGDN